MRLPSSSAVCCNRDREKPHASPTGSPGAVPRPWLPRHVACGLPALRASETAFQHRVALDAGIREHARWALSRVPLLALRAHVPTAHSLPTATTEPVARDERRLAVAVHLPGCPLETAPPRASPALQVPENRWRLADAAIANPPVPIPRQGGHDVLATAALVPCGEVRAGPRRLAPRPGRGGHVPSFGAFPPGKVPTEEAPFPGVVNSTFRMADWQGAKALMDALW